ncbi:hypothetical protein [Coleofasciculus sp. G2-EDA-02]|jgi:hypothetical protein|uniref:hypothetical protein n=1 Tax=Coleofasciculus sp. G2-EDA-02 TaxID=3069529 RepID=UPI0032F37758
MGSLGFVLLLFVFPLLGFDMSDSQSASDLANFFSDSLDWGIAASQGYLGYVAVVALAVYFFK